MKSAHDMSIQEATASYEGWLGEQTPLLPQELERKHELMSSAPLPFLRATYYRWTQSWSKVHESVRAAREVLAVGDLHVENFGTWRDAEGRLAWGVNDFDEVSRLPYTNDLVRLGTSVRLAISAGGLAITPQEADAAILSGYREGLEAGGRPFLLAERRRLLRRAASAKLEHPEKFWDKIQALPTVPSDKVPPGAIKVLAGLMPKEGLSLRYAGLVAGVGSLGRQRFVAIADWCGGKIAREAKAVARSAAFWSQPGEGEAKALYRTILKGAVRCQDPFITVKRRWIVRRLAPDCTRIELADLQKENELVRLLNAMGWETANIHLGTSGAHALLLDLVSRPEGWLRKAIDTMLAAVEADWKAWVKNPVVPAAGKADKGQKKGPEARAAKKESSKK
jgi:hypothetical protein